jgi:hypothetical protein
MVLFLFVISIMCYIVRGFVFFSEAAVAAWFVCYGDVMLKNVCFYAFVSYISCSYLCDGGVVAAVRQPWAVQLHAPAIAAAGVCGVAALTGVWKYTSGRVSEVESLWQDRFDKASNTCLFNVGIVNASLDACRASQGRAESMVDSLLRGGTELSKCQDERKRFSDKLIEYYEYVQKTTEMNNQLVLANQTNAAEIERLKNEANVLKEEGNALQRKNIFLADKSNRKEGELAEAKAFNRDLRVRMGKEQNKTAVCENKMAECEEKLKQRKGDALSCNTSLVLKEKEFSQYKEGSEERDRNAQEILVAYRRLRAAAKKVNDEKWFWEVIPSNLMPEY